VEHPYKSFPRRAFWKRAVSDGWDVESVANERRLILSDEIVASAGSCFALNIVPYIEQAGFRYFRIVGNETAFGKLTEDNFGYSKFSAGYGNIYTVRQAAQLVKRALGRFKPVEDRWVLGGDLVVDPFRPGLKYPATSEREFELLTKQHLREVIEVFRSAHVFVFTMGLTEAWISTTDGAVFPACPGTIRGEFDPARHAFHNFTLAEVSSDLDEFIRLAREINPLLRFVLTVSPVPLVATATGDHVLSATIYSKSVLRVAAAEAVNCHDNVSYFPAYEIVTGPQAPYDFFETDRREPSAKAIRDVMRAFIARCETKYQPEDEGPRRVQKNRLSVLESNSQELSRVLAEADCEEVAAGV
jgi:hypothetical protein